MTGWCCSRTARGWCWRPSATGCRGAFQVLRAALRRAVTLEDVELLGRVATASARINQRFLPKPKLEPLLELCRRNGGSGIQVAHSGTVAGLIFDPHRPGVDAAVQRCLAGIGEMGLTVTDQIGVEPAKAKVEITQMRVSG